MAQGYFGDGTVTCDRIRCPPVSSFYIANPVAFDRYLGLLLFKLGIQLTGCGAHSYNGILLKIFELCKRMKTRRQRKNQRGGDSEGIQALGRAIESRASFDTIKGILDKYPDLNLNEPYTMMNNYKILLLTKALVERMPDVAKLLIDKGANVNLQGPNGQLASQYAIRNIDMIRYFFDHGADLNKQDRYGQSALHYATYLDAAPLDVVQYLIEKGADVHQRDNKGNTPLNLASSLDIVKELIDHGADVHSQNNDSVTPLYWPIAYGKVDTVKYLLDHKANPNAIWNIETQYHGYKEQTPLMAALSANRNGEELLRLLILYGADPNQRTIDGQTIYTSIRRGDRGWLKNIIDNAVKARERRRELRQTGRDIVALQTLRSGLERPKYNISRTNVPNWLSEQLMRTLAGNRIKPNKNTKPIRPMGNINKTLKNLKRNYNLTGR